MKMTGNGRRWMEVVDEWELGGRQGDVPPGMGQPEPEKDSGKRDYYSTYPNAYLLRPEVRKKIFFSRAFSLLIVFDRMDRLLRVFSSCGGLREMLNGESLVMGFSKLSKNIHVRNWNRWIHSTT